MPDSIFIPVLIIIAALLVDALLGEVKRLHPLVMFGRLASAFEKTFNRPGERLNILYGSCSVLFVVLPVVLLFILLQQQLNSMGASGYQWLVEVLVLYFVIGRKSLMQHARAIHIPLYNKNIGQAREKLRFIVSRDTEKLDEKGICKATVESVVENSSDAIFGAIFWYLIAGAPGAVAYRLVNTLDAMWGYRSARFKTFGWFAARLDDVMNWVPARLTVFSFALLRLRPPGTCYKIIRNAFRQGRECSSPNAGPVMAAGACALNVKLGGEAFYHGQLMAKPQLGCGYDIEVDDIVRAIALVNRAVLLWVLILALIALLVEVN